MDGLLLSFIAHELTDKILGARVERVLQPEKDELHLLLHGASGNSRLLFCASASNARVHLTSQAKQNPAEPPMFCMLLRKLLGAGRVVAVRQMGGDRILEIEFDCADEFGDRTRRTLVAEIMGRHSNIILKNESGRILDAIRHVGADMSRVREVKPGLPYTSPPPQNKLDPETAQIEALRSALVEGATKLDTALSDAIAGIGRESARELSFRLTGEESPHLSVEARAALAEPLFALLGSLRTLYPPVLLLGDDGDPQDVFPFPQARYPEAQQRQVPEGVGAAMDAFYIRRDQKERQLQKSASLSRSIQSHIERCQNRLAIHLDALADEARIEEARVTGELLTANLHTLGGPCAVAEVFDYHTGNNRVIKMDPRLTPARNAQAFYKLYQKLRAAQRHAKDQVEHARAELETLESQLDDVRKCESALELDEIRAELVRAGYLRSTHSRGKQQKPAPSKPMSVRSSDGIQILVGKNSAQNDRLTQSAPPEALWLHVKGIAGSHVIVDRAGEVPETTLREAALLAAWFSRGYRSAQVPVDYTRKKHVRKPSGAAAGMVTYAGQKTLYVTPDEQAVKKLLDSVTSSKKN